MSASRKKQERKLAEAPELSTREQEELIKAEQHKRNSIIYTIIGVVVVVLAAILLIPWKALKTRQNRGGESRYNRERVSRPMLDPWIQQHLKYAAPKPSQSLEYNLSFSA